MIEWISDWAEVIIIAVIIATIIEMLLPEGNSKKYIKVVIGVYILFTIISPAISKFTGKSLAVSDVLDLNKYINDVREKETIQNLLQEENSASIRDIYIANLKADIINKLKGKGYVVTRIELDVGYDDSYTLNKIHLNATKEDDEESIVDNSTLNTNSVIINDVDEINISISNTQSNSDNKEDNENNLSNNDKNEIKEYLSSVYEINKKNILID